MSLKEKLDATDAAIARAQKRKNRAACSMSAVSRAARTHRLIQIGAILDHWLGGDADPEQVSALMESVAISSMGMSIGEWLASRYEAAGEDP